MKGWNDAAKQLPDSDMTVIIHCPDEDEPIWLGYHGGLRDARARDGVDGAAGTAGSGMKGMTA